MNSLHIASRQTSATQVPAAPVRLAKSSSSIDSAPFSRTLQDLETEADAASPATGRDAVRQDPVTMATNSRIASPANLPADAAAALAGSSSTGTMTREQARLILATGQGDVVTANQVYYGQSANPQTTTLASAGGAGGAASPAGPPTMYNPGQSASTEPTVYSTASYIKELNYSGYQAQANAENARRYQNYQVAVANWEKNGKVGTAPAAPQYETVDRTLFDQWWSQYQAGIAGGNGDAPAAKMFLANAPDYGNGYYGDPDTTKVGTRYSPTGGAAAV